MNTETRTWLHTHENRQRQYAQDLHTHAHNGSPEARQLLPHVTSAINALHTLSICEYTMYPEKRFATQQANKYTRRANQHEPGTTINTYNHLIASIFTDITPRCGDIGEPLETEEGDEEPLTIPTEWPTPTREPVPA